MNKNLVNKLLWGIYLALLAVLLPHTAWLFGRFEQDGTIGLIAAVAGAFAFEAAIAALTHKLSKHIEQTPKRTKAWKRFTDRYVNAYSFGLIMSVGVSALANLAHAVEFGRSLVIFGAWGIQPVIYQMAFGAILPIVSLVFARVLSNVNESEVDEDPALTTANEQIKSVRAELREAKTQLAMAEGRAKEAEARFGAAGDLFRMLMEGEKRERIIAVKRQWPELPLSGVAVLTGSSVSYASEVLSEVEK